MHKDLNYTIDYVSQNRMSETYGLTGGATGQLLLYFLLSRVLKDKKMLRRGHKFLEVIGENSGSISALNFSQGFLGIGWAVEWLTQEDLMADINTDEILVSIDQAVYRSISFSKTADLSLFTGVLGYVKYLEKRLSNQNIGIERYQKLSNLEAFVLLTDDLESTLLNDDGTFKKEVYTDSKLTLPDLANLLTICANGMKVNINKQTLEGLMFEGILFSDQILSEDFQHTSFKSLNEKNHLFGIFYLALCYLDAAKTYRHSIWQSNAERYIEKLESIVLKSNVSNTKLRFKKLSLLSLAYTFWPKNEYKVAALKCLKALSTEKLTDDLYMGKGHLVMAELALNKPSLTKNWLDLFFII